MPKTAIRAWSAGRDTDAAVAFYVMGWGATAVDSHVDITRPATVRAIREGCHGIAIEPERPVILRVSHNVCIPEFSTDIAAAWEVVERMVALGHRVAVHNRAVGPWACHVIVNGGQPNEWADLFYGSTAPVAICNAALAASGEASVAQEGGVHA